MSELPVICMAEKCDLIRMSGSEDWEKLVYNDDGKGNYRRGEEFVMGLCPAHATVIVREAGGIESLEQLILGNRSVESQGDELVTSYFRPTDYLRMLDINEVKNAVKT